MAFLEKAKKQDLVLLAEELGQKVSDKMTNIELRNIIIGSKDYEEEFVRDQLSVILEERFERESEEKIARQLAIEEEKIARQHAIQQLRWESELNELRLEIESIRSNVKRTSCAEDRKKTSSNYRISIGRAEEHVRETSPAVLMAEATIPVTTPIKEEKGMDDLRVVYVKVKGEQEMVNAVIDTGAQMPVVRPDVVEGQSINNRGSIQITSAFGEHEMGEVKDSNMELNDFRHGVVPVSKNLVNDMLICSSDYEVLIENSQMIRNPAKLREPSKKEGIISSTDSKSVCSQEVVTDLLPETQSLLNVPNGDLVAVKIKGSNVQTNGQGIKESKREVAFTCVFKNRILYSNRRGQPRKECISEFIDSILVQCCCDLITGIVKLELKAGLEVFKNQTLLRRLKGGGLYARRPVVCVPLTRQHRTARLQWCREHHNWTEQDWACVLFSDESRFSLSSDCRRQLIWRESGTAYRPKNIQEKDRYPTCSIMVWAGIMINGRKRLHVVVNGTMTGQRYIDEVLLPHVRLFRGAVGDKFVFMDDNATCHRTLAVQDCLDSEGIQRLVWPARSPDLNPIENVWDALGRQVAVRNYSPTNKNTLIRALTEEWDKLPQQLLDNVVQSTVRRVECCITLHGGHIPN
ncbi:transposable element Tcb2 transposase [Trichonephila clavipes]|uniref:Transposable element Tcb2 transposase n=1 Tax=Trichonephila clavipes TaxID=2585209 RepID=A0A8X6WC91_TRICX|nr:transposable element Tcb2 transposase [Trichonephila clavipes]